VRRRRLNEEYSFIWIVASVALIVVTIARGPVDRLALSLGILYGPALLLLLLGFFVAVSGLPFSMLLSLQRRPIYRLIKDVSLRDAQQRSLHAAGSLNRESTQTPAPHRAKAASQQ